MQRAFGKSAYKTVFLLTILTLGLAFAAFGIPVGAIDGLEVWEVDDDEWLYEQYDVYVGDDFLAVNGTGANPFTPVKIYWDEVSEDNFLAEDTSDNTGYFEIDEGDFEIPEADAGEHWIIASDGDSINLGVAVTVWPSLELDPEEGLPDDRVDVTGYGFGDEEDVELWFDLGGYYEEEVTRGTPSTNENGTFETWFYLPDVDEDDWDDFEVYANDTAGNEATATFTVGEYIDVDPDEGYPTYGPIEWEARAEADEDYQVVFVGVDLWVSLANVTSDDEGEMSGTFDVPYESLPGDYGPYYAREYQVELWDEDDDFIAGHDFDVYPYPHLEPDPDWARANETVDLIGGFFSREEDTEVTVTLDGIEIGVFETDEDGNFTDEFEVPDLAYGHYTLYAVDENGYEAEADFDVRPEGYGEMGTRNSVYFQGDHISFWVNTTDPIDNEEPLVLFVNITDPDGVLFWSPECELIDELHYWNVSQLIEGEYTDYYVLPYCEFPWKMQLPHDVTVGTWNWTAYDTDDYSSEYYWDEWAEGQFEVVERLTLDLVMDKLDEMKAQIEGLITDTNGDLVALINTNHGTLTASLSDLNAKVVEVEGDTATLLTDLGMVKADVADIADEFPLDIPETDLTPMWAAVALSLIAAIAAIAAVVIVYQRIA
jgi:hypothetical protein